MIKLNSVNDTIRESLWNSIMRPANLLFDNLVIEASWHLVSEQIWNLVWRSIGSLVADLIRYSVFESIKEEINDLYQNDTH